jgi:hypothetical protein
MPDTARHSLRLVVQHIEESGRSRFRLVGYGDTENYKPAEFASLDALREALAAVFPDLGNALPALDPEARGTSILLIRDAELDGRELRLLRLSE